MAMQENSGLTEAIPLKLLQLTVISLKTKVTSDMSKQSERVVKTSSLKEVVGLPKLRILVNVI